MTATVAETFPAAPGPQPRRADPRPAERDLKVIVVGAGFGGISVAVELKRVGIQRFLVLEENPEVGGVWWDNTYPGASCDVPAHLYSFEFDPYQDPTIRYPGQRETLNYLRDVADRHGLRPHLRLNTAVAAATYSDHDGRWTITTRGGESYRADAVVWAVGQLHRPHIPHIPGQDTFRGAAFHSARWDHSVDWAGRDVAVIGTGSSGAQIVPEVARTARSVTVYQRTASWVLPKPSARFGPLTRWAFAHIHALHRLYRAALYHGADRVLPPIMTGGWSARPAQWAARMHLWWRIRDPELRGRLTPRYRIGEKRILIDSAFYPALQQPHVQLVTDPIDCLAPDGIRISDGTERRADLVVYATGFKASEFLRPITICGRAGVDLHEQWRGGAEAFCGLAVEGFPSMWMIAGPNAFHPSGSNPAMKAFATRFIVRGIQYRNRLGTAIEVSPDAMRQYRRWLDAAMSRTVWPDGVPSWFKADSGRVTSPWPATARLFDQMTRQDPAHAFVAVPAAPPAPDPTGDHVPNTLVDNYCTEFLAFQLATVELDRRQAWTLCDIIPAGSQVDEQWLQAPGPRMAAEIRAAATDPHGGERWGVDLLALADLCESWHPAQGFAVLNAITRYRRAGGNYVQALHAVGLSP
ncbi:flavin-containing monooxygenase [Nocardia sp. CA-120079]|uniref:flavin-containing monooxygenase n=1 Tax=Nocardia sp. CA-120079 TaxID=3239974 RepID=UPI003D98CA13